MHRRTNILLLLILGVALGLTAVAQTKPNPGFEKMKTLVGQWQGTNAQGKPVSVKYELVSAKSALMETLVGDEGETMVTMYHADGDKMMMTHYCAAGNQPRMKAGNVAADAKQIAFSFQDATNLGSPDAGHMHGLTVAFVDKDHLNQTWMWREKGKPDKIETFHFTRKK